MSEIVLQSVKALDVEKQIPEIYDRLDRLFREAKKKDKAVYKVHIAGALGLTKKELGYWLRQKESAPDVEQIVVTPDKLMKKSKPELVEIRRLLIQMYVDLSEQQATEKASDCESKAAVKGICDILKAEYGYKPAEEVKVNASGNWESLLNAYTKH